MKKTLPSVFEYGDFRKFLADYQSARRQNDRDFTSAYICRKVGLPNTRSYFRDILNGKEITKTFVERFISLLEFTKEEAQYFRVLVQFNQAQNTDERELYFNQLISLNRTPKKIVSPDQYSYYREWHHSVIRALLDVIDFDNDYLKLANMLSPKITAKMARESIGLLQRLGLIAKNDREHLKPIDKSVTTGMVAGNELVKEFQMKCLDLAKEMILKNLTKTQNISTNVISVSQEAFSRIEQRLNVFKSEVRSIVHKDDKAADRVYQLNIQLFPNTK